MGVWYFVDSGHNRQGPVPAEALVEAYRLGQVREDSLVWRDGLAEWAPLRDFSGELGLAEVTPVATAPPPPITHVAPDEPTKKKNTGCLIALAIVVGGGLFLIIVLAILAAIALPAYQDYMIRAKVTQVLVETQAAKVAVASFQAETDRCPRDAAELQLEAPASYLIATLEVGALEGGACAVEVLLAPALQPAPLSNTRILMVLEDDGRWSCSSDDVKEQNLPAACR